jgi:hypothetical protein
MAHIYMQGKAQYAKVLEGQEDTGKNLVEGSDQHNKLLLTKGQFVMNLLMTQEAKDKAIADGIPDSGLVGQLWKKTNGQIYYKCTRKNFNPKFVNKDTGEQGVLMGPPTVLLDVEGENIPWDFEEMGYIGDGSDVVVKMNVWEGKLSEMLAVKVINHIKWVPEDNEGGF